ncbi:Hypothetical predicted protein [Cloeon dipterum]|uniref:FYVE-type domain-containing protein n=1 Tax=Cloeon dipterum TaxID=197152 RepID=A0A8S1CT23_9INSE|nr:Hypothetical predicted protein [Cloeon dipterum]
MLETKSSLWIPKLVSRVCYYDPKDTISSSNANYLTILTNTWFYSRHTPPDVIYARRMNLAPAVSTSDQFASQLGCKADTKVKVVAIFGNAGDGKSHTLNQLFFNGNEMFPESPAPYPCTIGVRAAFNKEDQIICLDTEGLQGATSKDNQRTRMLLKVLAVSDIVIYRTKSERLHNDLFTFLGNASKAYNQHFRDSLDRVAKESSDEPSNQMSASNLGPVVMIFHQTHYTAPLNMGVENSAEEQLRIRFGKSGYDLSAFSSLRYVGVQSQGGMTNFDSLKTMVLNEVGSTAARSKREVRFVLKALRALNEKFSGGIQDDRKHLFPVEFFSCQATCQSCKRRCELSMGHLTDGSSTEHKCAEICIYQNQYQNAVYCCITCERNGHRELAFSTEDQNSWMGPAKSVFSGMALNCNRCGVIYNSREFWYGNPSPEEAGTVKTETCHVWDVKAFVPAGVNTARRIVDGVTVISGVVAEASKAPTAALASWAADMIAPTYWKSNSEIIECTTCSKIFDSDSSKHHCRSCGQGFCENCSNFLRPVPERGWGVTPVRVCKPCSLIPLSSNMFTEENTDEVRARKVGEFVASTLASFSSVLSIPKDLIKNSAQPDYWEPDAEIKQCNVCSKDLPTPKERTHHCRDCGKGVCNACSSNKTPVPYRGWNTPVRVCDNCFKG